MRWRGMGWAALIGPLLGVALFTVGPAVLNVVKLPGPEWVTTAVAGLGGVFLLIATPLLEARLGNLTQRAQANEEQIRQQEVARQPLVGSDGIFPLVSEVADRALLGIHPAIPLPPGSSSDLSDELPTYIPRDIDADLHATLRRAGVTGGFILLVGPAASGKTRCAYEAIKAVLGDWRLCMPTSARHITALVESEIDLTHTVLWMNETQIFLGPGQLKVETVRRLLVDRKRPVILVGTIWPSEYDRLSAAPLTQGDIQESDWDSREILRLARRFSVKAFSKSEQERAQELSAADPRIAEAVTHTRSSIHLTEVLAAAPELIDRWEQAVNPFGAALISAGVEARLCGYPDPIPEDLLKILAVTHLSGAERAQASPDWHIQALRWACEPVRGSAAPLTPHAAEIGSLDGYSVTDIIVQHRQINLAENRIADPQWDSLIEYAAPDICEPIGLAASAQGHFTHGERAWRKAFNGGLGRAAVPLGFFLYLEGETDESRIWWNRAIETEGHAAATIIGNLVYGQGHLAEARRWWERAVELGGSATSVSIGQQLYTLEDIDEARTWWRRAVEIGGCATGAVIGDWLFDDGDLEEARIWWERAVQLGGPPTAATIGDQLHTLSNIEEARIWWGRAVELGGASAAATTGSHFLGLSDIDEARVWWEHAVRLGGAPSALGIGMDCHTHGELEEARIWWQRAIEIAGPVAAVVLGQELSECGAIEEARRWWTLAAEAGQADALALLENSRGQIQADGT